MNREEIIEASRQSDCEMDCCDCKMDITNRADAVDGYCSSKSVKCPFELGAEWMQEQCHKDFLEASAEIERQHVQDIRDLQENMIENACEWWSKHATEYLIDIEPSRYKPPRYIISLQAKIDYVKEMIGE